MRLRLDRDSLFFAVRPLKFNLAWPSGIAKDKAGRALSQHAIPGVEPPAGRGGAAGGDGRLWLLRRAMRIPYWTKQREQVLKLGRRGLASALAAELALNI